MSAQGAMAGLFPPHGNQIWNKNINWQPIPVHTMPTDQDILFHSPLCDRFDHEIMEYFNSTAYKMLFEQSKPLIDYLEENSGQKLNTLFDVSYLHGILFVEKLKGYRYAFPLDKYFKIVR